MATKQTWKLVKKYFRPDSKVDKWGDPDLISDNTLLKIYDFRVHVGVPIYVLHGVKKSGHKKNSEHYAKFNSSGRLIKEPSALDIILPDYELSPFDLVMEASRFGFTGLGYYPHWKWKGKVVGGLHVDSRPLKLQADGTLDFKYSRWMGVPFEKEKNGKKIITQEYVALNFHNLLAYTNYGEQEVRNDLQ